MRSALLLTLMLATPVAAQAGADLVTLVDRGYLRQAEPLLVARLSLTPTDPEALLLLARVRGDQDRLDEALKLAEQALAAAPNEARTHYLVSEICGRKAQKAGVLKAAGLAKRFKREVDATLALDPRHTDALEASIEFHQQAPGFMGGDKKQIPLLLDRLTAVDPALAWTRRARTAQRQKDTTSAEAHFRKAVAAESRGGDAHLALARFLSPRHRKPAEALVLALEAAQRMPWRQDAWGVAAYLRVEQGGVADAEVTLARAEAADPTRFGSSYMVGRSLMNEGRELAFAEKLVRRYLQQEPEYGWPSLADANWCLGRVLEKQGRKPEAIAALQTALRLQPDLESAKKDLKRLKG